MSETLTSKFFVTQRVCQRDPDDNTIVHGTVTKVFDSSVYIKWDDLKEDTRHDDPEDIDSIKPSKTA